MNWEQYFEPAFLSRFFLVSHGGRSHRETRAFTVPLYEACPDEGRAVQKSFFGLQGPDRKAAFSSQGRKAFTKNAREIKGTNIFLTKGSLWYFAYT
jgi:hypothetical protein